MNDRRYLLGIALLALLPFLEPLATNHLLTFRDHSDYFVPLRHFTASVLKSGSIPFWNPYNAFGEPWFANPQTGVFYPPSWVFLVAPFSRAYVLFLAFHTALLGCGSFLLLRRWIPSPPLAMFGATATMFCGSTISLLDINNVLASLSWLPLALWCSLRRCDEKPVPVAAPAACLTLMFLGGEPSFALLGAVACAGIVAFRARRPLRDLVLLTTAVFTTSAFQLLPFLHWLKGSDRIAGLDPGSAFASSIAPLEWISIALSPATTLIPGVLDRSQYFIPSSYLGAPILVGLIAAIFSLPALLRSQNRTVLFVMTGVLGLVIVIAAGRFIPKLMDLLVQLHLNVNRHPARVAPIGALAIIVIGIIGLSTIPRLRLTHRVASAVISTAATALAFALYRPKVPIGTNLIEPTLFFTLTILVILLRPSWLEQKELLLFGVVLFAFDLLHGSRALLPSGEFMSSIAPYRAIVDAPSRVLRIPSPQSFGTGMPDDKRHFLTGYLNLTDRIFDASTAAPVVPTRHQAFEQLVLSEARTDVLDFLSLGWILTARPIQQDRFEPTNRVGPIIVYRNWSAMPMVTLWRTYVDAATEEEAFELIRRGTVDLDSQLVVEGAPGTLRSELDRSRNHPLRASLRWSFEPNRVRVEVDASESAILVLNQVNAKGWDVRVDDRAATSLRVNARFRGVFVSAGKHEIIWSYEPPLLRLGALLSLAGFGWMVFDWRSANRVR